jgi:hypothetical protein
MLKFSVALVLFVAFFLSTCDESLPPRVEPQRFLRAEYAFATGVVEIRDSVAVGLGGAFTVSVRNLYAEVLQDSEAARVELDISLRDLPEQRGKAVATRRDLTDQSIVSRGLLTLLPNVDAIFLKQWEHRTSTGRRFWEFVRLTQKVTPRGEPYLESDPVNLVASGKVQLFKAKAPERLPQIHVALVYRIF